MKTSLLVLSLFLVSCGTGWQSDTRCAVSGKSCKDGKTVIIEGDPGPVGPVGPAGSDGADGRDAPVCEYSSVPGGVVISCPHGDFLISDGVDGVDGQDGADGQDGQDGADGVDGQDGQDGADGVDGQDGQDGVDGQPLGTVGIAEIILPCPATVSDFPEVLLRLTGGSVLAHFSHGNKQHFTLLVPGKKYKTTDGRHCEFKFNVDLSLEDDEGNVWLP